MPECRIDSALPVSQTVAAAIAVNAGANFSRDIPLIRLQPADGALAVELAPGPNGVTDLPSANYQQKVAAAIADAVASQRQRLRPSHDSRHLPRS